MRERIRGPEPAVWREHREPVGLESRGDPALAVDQRSLGEAGGERVRVLVHPEHPPPMRRALADLYPLEQFPDRPRGPAPPPGPHQPAAPPEGGPGFRPP